MLSPQDLVRDGEVYCFIEGEGSKFFTGKVPSQLPEQAPSTLSSIFDDISWNNFRNRVNPLISQINKWFRLLFILSTLSIAVVITLYFLLFEKQEQIESIIVVVFIAFIFNLKFVVIKKNARIDQEIESILEDEYKDSLRSKGYGVEYRTKWTGYFKPNHAVPLRVIVFPKLENANDIENDAENTVTYSTETQQEQPKNNDVDKAAWGLNYETTSNVLTQEVKDKDGLDLDAWGL